MSSAPPGRYQSRLFNFLNKQSQRLSDQYDRTVRHIKVAAVWGSQILLYPVYMMVQAGLTAGRQLSSSAATGWLPIKALTNSHPQQETPPTADTPIKQVLAEINILSPKVQGKAIKGTPTAIAKLSTSNTETNLTIASPQGIVINQKSSTFTASGEVVTTSQTDLNTTTQEASLIQGIATLLETRALVLVSVENQILDILTPQQQQKLATKISWELADLRRKWRLAARQFPAQRRFDAVLSQPRILPPVRLFWHLMAWVQTSPVAIAANLFQESTLVVSNNPSIPRPRHQILLNNQRIALPPQANSTTNTPGAIAFLDRTIAELESHQLVPGTEIVVALSDQTRSVYSSAKLRSVTLSLSLKERSQQLLYDLQTKVSKSDNQAPTARIQSLIYAAVDYFFGKHRSTLSGSDFQPFSLSSNQQRKVEQLSGHQSTFLPSAKQLSGLKFADNTEPDPWLSWDDLYGSALPPGQVQSTPAMGKNKPPKRLPEAFNSQTPVRFGNSILSFIKRSLGFKATSGKLSAPTPIDEPNLIPTPLAVQPPATLKTSSQNKSHTSIKGKTLSANTVSRSSKTLPEKKANSAITPSTPTANNHLESKPDWIETQATPNGYVKHPLEQLLGWLDSAMLWLEELFVKIWHWIRGR